MQLSKHFTLEEMTRSMVAARKGIDNTPGAGEIKNLEKTLTGKLDEIKKDLQDLGDVYATVDADRRASFDRDMTPDEIKTFSIKNRLP